MTENEAQPKSGAFRWNAGGWFGAQIGATAWIALLGILLLFDAPLLGVFVLAYAAAPNVIGIILWRMRDRVGPYPATQILVAVSGAFALVAFVSLDVVGRIAMLRPGAGRRVYLVLLVYPGLMLVFHLRNRAGRRCRGTDDP